MNMWAVMRCTKWSGCYGSLQSRHCSQTLVKTDDNKCAQGPSEPTLNKNVYHTAIGFENLPVPSSVSGRLSERINYRIKFYALKLA